MRETGVELCGRPVRAVVTESFLDALLGIHGVSLDVDALVVRGSSVHGLTLRRAIWVFGLDGSGAGVDGKLLRPGRIVMFPGASHVVELPRGLDCEGEHRSHTIRWSG